MVPTSVADLPFLSTEFTGESQSRVDGAHGINYDSGHVMLLDRRSKMIDLPGGTYIKGTYAAYECRNLNFTERSELATSVNRNHYLVVNLHPH